MIAIVPNAMRGSHSASEVFQALASGISDSLPGVRLYGQPAADGGDGTLSVLADAGALEVVSVEAREHDGSLRAYPIGRLGNSTYLIESAIVCGERALARVPSDMRSSYACGSIIKHLVLAGAERIYVSLGGTLTTDAGVGALEALGVAFIDTQGRLASPLPLLRPAVVGANFSTARRLLADTEICLLYDVHVPFLRNPALFGKQKGLSDTQVELAGTAFRRFASIAQIDPSARWRTRIRRALVSAGSGAGGGIGFGLSLVAKTRFDCGAETILKWTGATDSWRRANQVVTAEGRIDRTTYMGKLPGHIALERASKGQTTFIVAAVSEFDSPVPNKIFHIAIADWRESVTLSTLRSAGRDLGERISRQ